MKDLISDPPASPPLLNVSLDMARTIPALSHEMLNHLAPIQYSLHAIHARQTMDEDSLRRGLSIIERQVGHLSQLLHDLNGLSQIVQGKLVLSPAVVDLADILNRAADGQRRMIEERRQILSIECPDPSLRLEADPHRLGLILRYLLDNAIHFTPDGGRIGLEGARIGDRAVIRVRDTGAGIQPELLDRVFEPFFRSEFSSKWSGLGIGLTIARSLAALHGGGITAASTGPDQGSIFTVELPLLFR